MLQIDHVYEFLYQELFKDFEVLYIYNGVPKLGNINLDDISVFTRKQSLDRKIFLFDQEPAINQILSPYLDVFTWEKQYSVDELIEFGKNNSLPYGIKIPNGQLDIIIEKFKLKTTNTSYTLVTSEFSKDIDLLTEKYNMTKLYYFFHGFAALDWYRGYYALNYNKQLKKSYEYDFISFNRIITDDRSYRIYFISLLKELGLLDRGQVSFNVTDNLFDDWRDEVSNPDSKLSELARQHAECHLTGIDKLIIDRAVLPGSASADIPRTIDSWIHPDFYKPVDIDSFWHIVTETVFYYDKLHLTEKIFKPIVSKQPFMLLAAPGNLAYLKSYGFKTFDFIIDESYDLIQDNDKRIEAVVSQMKWYCNLSDQEKINVIRAVEPIVQHNFHHFYGDFKRIITQELITNTKALFQEIEYDDSHINYEAIYNTLTH